MDTPSSRDQGLSPDLLAELDAVASAEDRSAGEVLREAVEKYLRDRKSDPTPKRSPLEAAERMLQSRKSRPLPQGTSIRDLIVQGRT